MPVTTKILFAIQYKSKYLIYLFLCLYTRLSLERQQGFILDFVSGGVGWKQGVWGTEVPSGVLGKSPSKGSGGRSPQKLKLVC